MPVARAPRKCAHPSAVALAAARPAMMGGVGEPPAPQPAATSSSAAVDLVVLDIAGTTVQEHGAVYEALEDAVVAAGGCPSAGDVEAWMGADKRAAITALLAVHRPRAPAPTAAEVEAVYEDFRQRLLERYRRTPPTPIDGVEEMFETLRALGVKIALTTGFSRDVTEPLLAQLGWTAATLDAVVTVDDVPSGRPAPFLIFRAMERTGVHDVRRVLVAGDTTRDLQAGTNAGATFVVGVLTGSQPAAVLGGARHTHLLASVAGIVDLVR